jgi:dephospho-CoA kinase
MIKVAVTGNIGSGKSEFINFISKLGFYYISSDVIISNLYEDFKTRSIILQKLDLNEKNYKQEIISNIHNEAFNRQLKKVIYPFLYSKKKKFYLKNIKHINLYFTRYHYFMKKTYLVTTTLQSSLKQI